MKTSDNAAEKFLILLDYSVLTPNRLTDAITSAEARAVDIETVLIREYEVSRHALIHAFADYYQCPYVEFDERMPVPPELLDGLDGDRLSISHWFPIAREGNKIIIAANDPPNPLILSEAKKYFGSGEYEVWFALREDIRWFIKDFLHAKPGRLAGTERTGLALWRNTMAQWRTKLSCYRTDLAKGRTSLTVLRWGLAVIAVADVFIHSGKPGTPLTIYWAMLGAGLLMAAFGLVGYLKIRKLRMKSPENQTLIQETAATLYFLENYHFIENTGVNTATKGTMLARLGDFLSNHCTILYPKPASKVRTQLTREKSVLGAQRTVAACYRTIYARARTGLAFIRTGVSFSSLGLVLMKYFAFSFLAVIDIMLLAAGMLMIVDGALWYLPVRKEQSEMPRCPVPE
jgi:uncharacterized membrane protein YidH (DUF202 family)